MKSIQQFFARALLAVALLAPVPAIAAQGSLCMPTSGTVSGLTLANDINAALAALASSNSGSSAPANPCGSAPVAGQIWLDGSTSPATVRIYDGTGSNWLAIGTVDATNHRFQPNGYGIKLTGTTSGSTVLVPTAAASGTLTLPAATDQLVGRATTDTLTNKTLSDTTSAIVNATDATKKAVFSASAITTGTTRTLTIPDASGTLALTSNIIQAPGGSYSQLKVQATSDTGVSVTCKEIVLEDASNNTIRAITPSLTLTTATTGANGLDTGTVAASTWYSVWIISNGTTTAGLLSTSQTSPAMPGGYTYKARVGCVRVDASSHLWRTLQYDRRTQLTIGTNPTASPTMANGSAGSYAIPTWVAIAVGNYVPPTATEIITIFQNSYNNLAASNMILAPSNGFGNTVSTNPPPFFWTNNDNRIVEADLILETTNIYWASSAGGGAVLLWGWQDNL